MVALQPLLKQRGVGWRTPDGRPDGHHEEGRRKKCLELLKRKGEAATEQQQQHVPLGQHIGKNDWQYLTNLLLWILNEFCKSAPFIQFESSLKFYTSDPRSLVSSVIPQGRTDTKQKMERVFL